MIFVSSSCSKHKKIGAVIQELVEHGLNGIELSGGTEYYEDYEDDIINLREKHSLNLLVHNYFPPHQQPFVVNLASNDQGILEFSRKHCREAIKLSSRFKAPFYGVHAGFCFHARPEHLGTRFCKVNAFSKKEAHEIFVESIQQLADYALQYHMTVAIENNVLTHSNLQNGKNTLLLGVTSDEILNVIESVKRENVAVLIDVGHLKVSAQTLGFSPLMFIKNIAHLTVALHLSENNGVIDEHRAIREDSWFWDSLTKGLFPHVTFTLEVHNCSISYIQKQIALISSKIATSNERNYEKTS
jgi:sugar phosphate isomerase/epimerase